MTDREYLSQLKTIDGKIRYKCDEEQRWKDIATNMTAKISENKVQSSKNPDPLGEAITRAVTYQRECADLTIKLIELKHTITDQIDSLNDDLAHYLLIAVFIDNKTYNDISEEKDWTYNHTLKEIRKAILMFGDKYRELYKDS